MNNKIIFPLLTSEDIEVKVKQVTKTGALFLLYKTARVDARILDETVGVMNWECNYQEIKGNLYCGVGIRDSEEKAFVWKYDCGIESGQDDGQEKKAEASDAFKRACSRLGIGRELYTSPQIWANVATIQKGDKWYLQDPYAKYVVTDIQYNEETRTIIKLQIKNAKTGVSVFDWELDASGAMGEKMVKTFSTQEEKKSEPTKEAQQPTKLSLKDLKTGIGLMVKHMREKDNSTEGYQNIVKKVTGDNSFKCNTATEDQIDIVQAIYDELVAGGYNG